MQVLILYDSLFGNTEKIAKEIASVFSGSNAVKVLNVAEVEAQDLDNMDLIIVGSPTHQGRPQQTLVDFFAEIPKKKLQNVHFAVFDTRLGEQKQSLTSKITSQSFDQASSKLYSLLWEKGGKSVTDPFQFTILEKEGPLKEGEIDRAKAWAKEIIRKV